MKCKYCFSEIPNNATFCKYCGSVLDSSANARVQQASSKNGQIAAPVKKHTFRKFLLFIFVSFLVLSLVAYALIFIFFPAKRYYANELTVTMDGEETSYSYNHRGFVTKETQDGKELFKVEFDSDGRISEFSFNHRGSTEAFKIHNYSSLSSEYTGSADLSIQGEKYILYLEYNKQNNLTFFSISKDEKYELVSARLDYNEFGIMTKAEVKNLDQNQLREYDYKGDLLIEENYIDNILVSSYEYRNRVLQKSSEVQELNNGSIVSYVNTTYNENELPLTCETFNGSNERVSYYSVESETDDLVIMVEKEDKTDNVISYREYYLNSDGQIERTKQLDSKKELLTRVEISYDREGNVTSRRGYDSEGNQLSSMEYSYKKIPLFLFD